MLGWYGGRGEKRLQRWVVPRRVPWDGGSASPNSTGVLAVPGTQCPVAGDKCWELRVL